MSKFLSLEWFKSKVEHSIDRVVGNKLEQLMAEEDNNGSTETPSKPYQSARLINETLTIVMNDGDILTKPDATPEIFGKIRECTTENDILLLVSDSNVVKEKVAKEKKIKRAKAVIKGLEILKGCGHFDIKDNEVRLKGMTRTMPQLLVEEFINVVADHEENNPDVSLEDNEQFIGLKRFFMWCCLNPRAEVAHELYRFLKDNSFRITKQGFFVALRNVVTVGPEGNTKKVEFISNAYNKVKAVWKKSVLDFEVVERNGEYQLQKMNNRKKSKEALGTLKELYLALPDMQENRFTDAWTQTFDIRVGKVVEMPKEDCNWSTQDCMAAGLHFTADHINYVGCGDTSVLILINPMKVVGIGSKKGRCYEYLPIMTVPTEESTQILHDVAFDTFELDDDYAILQLEELKEKVKEGFTAESKKYSFNLPEISTKEIDKMVKSLSEMKKSITKRVISLK